MIRQNYNDLCMEERPQYRAYNYGMDTLSNVELLSLVMNRGAGTKESLQQARQRQAIIYNKVQGRHFCLPCFRKFFA